MLQPELGQAMRQGRRSCSANLGWCHHGTHAAQHGDIEARSPEEVPLLPRDLQQMTLGDLCMARVGRAGAPAAHGQHGDDVTVAPARS